MQCLYGFETWLIEQPSCNNSTLSSLSFGEMTFLLSHLVYLFLYLPVTQRDDLLHCCGLYSEKCAWIINLNQAHLINASYKANILVWVVEVPPSISGYISATSFPTVRTNFLYSSLPSTPSSTESMRPPPSSSL